jgi:hypothetical protein
MKPVELKYLPLDPKEREHALLIQHTLDWLQYYADCFLAATGLYDHAEFHYQLAPKPPFPDRMPMTRDQQRYMNWKMIAGRDGAITLYNIDESFQAVSASLDLTPSVKSEIDIDLMRKARKTFRKHFPDVKNMRDAIAHAAELINTPAKNFANPIKGKGKGKVIVPPVVGQKGGKITIKDCFQDRTFMSTAKGQLVKYDLTLASHQVILSCVEEFISAFPVVNW